MSHPLKVVAVSGGMYKPSRTLALVEALVVEVAKHTPTESQIVKLSDVGRSLGGALSRKEVPDTVDYELRRIESADLLIVATPVFRGSYTGQFKHLFDLIHHESLIGVPVMLAATGGSDRHALVIDHLLRPLFSFFQTATLPLGVYGSEADFTDHAVASDSLKARISLAVERALSFFRPAATSHRKIA